MIFGPVPPFVVFFAVAMGVNHAKNKNRQAAHHQDDEHGVILPDRFDKFGQIRIHAKTSYTTSAGKVNKITAGMGF